LQLLVQDARPLLVLRRALTRELWLTVAGTILVLFLIVLSSKFTHYLALAAAGRLPARVVFVLMGLSTLAYGTVLLPVGGFVGLMIVFGRLWRDNEMIAIATSGLSPLGLYRLVARPIVGLVLLTAFLTLFLAPWALRTAHEVRRQAARTVRRTLFRQGRFHELGYEHTTLYARRVSPGGRRLRSIFVAQDVNGRPVVVTARRGHFRRGPSGLHEIVLEQGYRIVGRPGTPLYERTRFSRYVADLHGLHFATGARDHGRLPIDAVSTGALLRRPTPADWAELEWRLSPPLMLFIFAFLALPLAQTSPRSTRFVRPFLAVLIYLLYSNLLGASKVWVRRGSLNPLIGLWWVHLGFVLLTVGLLLPLYGREARRFGRRRVS
jgi:lipopolysaccharide export system permease protein